MPRHRNLERDVVGAEIYVRVAGGFLPIQPAIRPDSSLRFHRGIAPPARAVPLYRPDTQPPPSAAKEK